MLILASASPRRTEILRSAGLEFRVQPGTVEEQPHFGEEPLKYVRRLARDKALAASAAETDIVLAADTVVVVDGAILEKPADHEDAARMLRLLSGRDHEVITGICLRRGSGLIVEAESTRVFFTPLSEREVLDYVASGEPMDKAGAYAIQGLASKFVERVEGCYFNVVGLPVALVYRQLKTLWQNT